MQVYRGMDIGTAKPTSDERRRAPHFMIDLVEPEVPFTVAMFQREARKIIGATHGTMIICGGSGLHFRSVVDAMTFPPHSPEMRRELEAVSDPVAELLDVDPGAGEVLDLANPRRVIRALEVWRLTGLTPTERAGSEEARALREYESLYPFAAVGLDPGEELESRVVARIEAMRQAGLLEEVARLRGRLGPTASLAVGYRQLMPVVTGNLSDTEGWEAVRTETLALARRQRTFFGKDPRVRWVPWHDSPTRRLDRVREELEL
jgi:tRNA dimethylallyltransferase